MEAAPARGTLILLQEESPSCLDPGLLKEQRTEGDISKDGDIEGPSPHFFLETLETSFEGKLPGALGIRVYNKEGMHSRV